MVPQALANWQTEPEQTEEAGESFANLPSQHTPEQLQCPCWFLGEAEGNSTRHNGIDGVQSLADRRMDDVNRAPLPQKPYVWPKKLHASLCPQITRSPVPCRQGQIQRKLGEESAEQRYVHQFVQLVFDNFAASSVGNLEGTCDLSVDEYTII